jgi:hypothetical protein
METLADRVTLVQAESAQLTQDLHAVPADAWRQPSACTQWQIHKERHATTMGGHVPC